MYKAISCLGIFTVEQAVEARKRGLGRFVTAKQLAALDKALVQRGLLGAPPAVRDVD
jgi:hypothetical protein